MRDFPFSLPLCVWESDMRVAAVISLIVEGEKRGLLALMYVCCFLCSTC